MGTPSPGGRSCGQGAVRGARAPRRGTWVCKAPASASGSFRPEALSLRNSEGWGPSQAQAAVGAGELASESSGGTGGEPEVPPTGTPAGPGSSGCVSRRKGQGPERSFSEGVSQSSLPPGQGRLCAPMSLGGGGRCAEGTALALALASPALRAPTRDAVPRHQGSACAAAYVLYFNPHLGRRFLLPQM